MDGGGGGKGPGGGGGPAPGAGGGGGGPAQPAAAMSAAAVIDEALAKAPLVIFSKTTWYAAPSTAAHPHGWRRR